MSTAVKDIYFPMSVVMPTNRMLGLEQGGEGFEKLLEIMELTEQEFNSPKTKVNGEQLITYYNWVMESNEDLSVKKRLEYHSATTLGLAGLAVMSSTSVREGLDIAVKALPLYMPAMKVHIEEDISCQKAMFELVADFREINVLLMEMTIGVINLVSTEVFGGSMFKQIHFKHANQLGTPSSMSQQEYNEVFGCEVVFSSTYNGMLFEAEGLEIPASKANKFTFNMAKDILAKEIDASQQHTRMVSRVRDALEKSAQEDQFLTLNELAAALNMTTRTLSRKLSRENTTYKALLNEVRFWRAKELLSYSDRSLKQIATKSGFSGTEVFSRAFKAEFGETPATWREKNKK